MFQIASHFSNCLCTYLNVGSYTPGNDITELTTEKTARGLGLVNVDNGTESIHRITVDENVHLVRIEEENGQ